jgi:DMSO/TMAO reductase YedYZ molybdopterin-dependent catalytic subunit
MNLNGNQLSRRRFLASGAALGASAAQAWQARSQDVVTLPFENGERQLVKYPQKRPLLRLTARPPQLETPFAAFDEGALTANDTFFVRYHLALSPPPAEELAKFKLSLRGAVKTPLSLTIEQLKSEFEPAEIVAVNQCSGNSRGFVKPRVPGGQSGNGMMGNARWKGVPLKAVLNKAGVSAGATQAVFDGLDRSLLPQTPDFIKSLDVDHALGGEVMLAWEMNGEVLPWLNGYPLRLVVPGYYGTYWVKHVHDIQVVEKNYEGYWMDPAYRIPDNEGACVEPGAKPNRTVPINRLNVRSFITSHQDGSEMRKGVATEIRGLAFDGGEGIRTVLFSADGGRNWREAELEEDLGRYSFRRWKTMFAAEKAGAADLRVRAINRIGQSQPDEALWNPAGYMRNVVESVTVKVV